MNCGPSPSTCEDSMRAESSAFCGQQEHLNPQALRGGGRSRMDGLVHLYHKLSSGGTLIVDDYYLFEAQRKAVDEFRAAHRITDPIIQIDHFGGYWIKGHRA